MPRLPKISSRTAATAAGMPRNSAPALWLSTAAISTITSATARENAAPGIDADEQERQQEGNAATEEQADVVGRSVDAGEPPRAGFGGDDGFPVGELVQSDHGDDNTPAINKASTRRSSVRRSRTVARRIR